jgi:cytochrome P450 family 4 subfamily B polypeptide 1
LCSYLPYHFSLIYHLSPSGWKFRKANRVAHEFSQKVITERRKALATKNVTLPLLQCRLCVCDFYLCSMQTSNGTMTRKYLDFLDILIEAKVLVAK